MESRLKRVSFVSAGGAVGVEIWEARGGCEAADSEDAGGQVMARPLDAPSR